MTSRRSFLRNLVAAVVLAPVMAGLVNRIEPLNIGVREANFEGVLKVPEWGCEIPFQDELVMAS